MTLAPVLALGIADSLYWEVADYGTVLVGFTDPAGPSSDGAAEIDACVKR